MEVQISKEGTHPQNPCLLFVGDCKDPKYGSRFLVNSRVSKYIRLVKYSIMNLEGHVGTATPIQKWSPIRNQIEVFIDRLLDVDFDSATFANNHTMDHGAEGLSLIPDTV